MQRVAVRHTDESHPNSHWFAFGMGAIQGFDDPISGKAYSEEEVAQALLRRAQDQFSESDGYQHRIETLHIVDQDADGSIVGGWLPLGESDLPLIEQGQTTTQTLEAEQGQEGTAQ